MRKTLLFAILCGVPIFSSCLAVAGLAGAGVVVGYVYYDKNEAHQDFSATFDKTWKATLEVLHDQHYDIPKEVEHQPDSGEIRIENLAVKVERYPGNVTRVSVRIGTFDTPEHRRRAGLILEHIEKEL